MGGVYFFLDHWKRIVLEVVHLIPHPPSIRPFNPPRHRPPAPWLVDRPAADLEACRWLERWLHVEWTVRFSFSISICEDTNNQTHRREIIALEKLANSGRALDLPEWFEHTIQLTPHRPPWSTMLEAPCCGTVYGAGMTLKLRAGGRPELSSKCPWQSSF